jgi:hypothetical protein
MDGLSAAGPASEVKSQNLYHVINSVLIISLSASSLVLSKRIEECSPMQSTNEMNERKSIMALSAIALALVLIKCVAQHVQKLKAFHPWLHAMYNVIVFVLAILNISFWSKQKTEPCAASSNYNSTDMHANKELVLTVLILSILVVVFQAREGIAFASKWWSMKKKGK